MNPVTDSAREIARAVNARTASAAEIAEALIPHAERVDAQLNAYLELTPQLMRAHAKRVDKGLAACRRARRDKGQHVPDGPAHDGRLEDPRELRRAVHRDRGSAAARRGR